VLVARREGLLRDPRAVAPAIDCLVAAAGNMREGSFDGLAAAIPGAELNETFKTFI
jgi:hypothetical protein